MREPSSDLVAEANLLERGGEDVVKEEKTMKQINTVQYTARLNFPSVL
jgi:hypothetical protein